MQSTTKLGATEIRWLSDLAVSDFDIKYRSGKTNRNADVLNRKTAHRVEPTNFRINIRDEEVHSIKVDTLETVIPE